MTIENLNSYFAKILILNWAVNFQRFKLHVVLLKICLKVQRDCDYIQKDKNISDTFCTAIVKTTIKPNHCKSVTIRCVVSDKLPFVTYIVFSSINNCICYIRRLSYTKYTLVIIKILNWANGQLSWAYHFPLSKETIT